MPARVQRHRKELRPLLDHQPVTQPGMPTVDFQHIALYEERGKEREALDVIPVRVTEEQVRPASAGPKCAAHQICPQSAQP